MCLSSSLHWNIFYDLNYCQKISLFLYLYFVCLYFSYPTVVRLRWEDVLNGVAATATILRNGDENKDESGNNQKEGNP